MKVLFHVFSAIVFLGLSACNFSGTEDVITVGDRDAQTSNWEDQGEPSSMEVSTLDTNEFTLFSKNDSIYVVKERYSVKGDQSHEIWVVYRMPKEAGDSKTPI